ncbi:MAG: hypothetical protein J6V58_03485 [Clostridia bacterium]|nr:hypothetical protein [Clostridia bacterium]
MSIISEKVSYLCGLAEGMKIDTNTNEGKLLTEIISALGEIADELEFMDESIDELSDKVFELEDEVYGEDDCDCDCDCDEPFVVNCPNCNEDFFVYMEDLEDDEEIACPNCGQEVELEFDDCDCCDCDDCE